MKTIKTRTKLNENPIKSAVRKMILEGEMENAESALAAKDLVDRLQDTVVEIGKMSNDELPHLIDSIRASFGPDAASAYQDVANGVLSELLDILKTKKTELENATLTLTGDATAAAPTDDLGLPEEGAEDGLGDDLDAEPIEGEDLGAKPSKTNNPLGRDTRVPTEESRKWNKRLTEAKIIALHEALQKTDSTKAPIKAKRLAEELKRLVTIAIKEEAKAKTISEASYRSKTDAARKKDPKKEKVANKKTPLKSGKKPEWLFKKEVADEEKEGKKSAKKDEKKPFQKKSK